MAFSLLFVTCEIFACKSKAKCSEGQKLESTPRITIRADSRRIQRDEANIALSGTGDNGKREFPAFLLGRTRLDYLKEASFKLSP